MKKQFRGRDVFWLLAVCLTVNGFALVRLHPGVLLWLLPLFVAVNLLAGRGGVKARSRRLRRSFRGAYLLRLYTISSGVSLFLHLLMIGSGLWVLWSFLFCAVMEIILFVNGMLCVCLASSQLSLKQRTTGILCGLIPVANLFVLPKLTKTVFREVAFETEKELRNREREQDKICNTKYPLLMVHGVFFRDSRYFNYWGRIPKELEANGAVIHYGNHQSAASVAKSAEELTRRIRQIVEQTGCEKVNIIAHSKGGLDCRYAVARLGAAPYVASLTTVNTPHRGCLFADHLLTVIPEGTKNKVADTYNAALKKFGDHDPDFLAAVNDLTAQCCTKLDDELELPEGVFCQSIGSVIEAASGGKFPLNFTYHLVRFFDGANDGLVAESSFAWGQRYQLLKPPQGRGISHGDVIDLNRENIEGFDVREFYVELVRDLKNRGL